MVQLDYTVRTLGAPLQRIPTLALSLCRSHTCAQKRTSIICLFLIVILVFHGLFPMAPSQPRMAVSVKLLAFYQTLFERSCDAVNALASALHTHYDELENALSACWDRVEAEHRECQNVSASDATAPELLIPRERCASILTQRCPACFGGIAFGQDLSEGGDIHVATDGNFHHWHRRSAGDSPHFYDTSYFLPKAQVDTIDHRILRSRKSPPRLHKSLVPHDAIDKCENSYEAADGKKQKSSMDSFDDTGVMALICRHDIPLFFANIDTPGEQQKYAVALIDHLSALLPPRATVVTLYDVGCVLSRSLHQYDILPPTIMKRLRFATTAMHAYGHEWACQLEYNPRMCHGLGLSDGKGTERLWSRLVRLIGIQHSSSVTAIGLEMRTDLGDWIKRRLKRGVGEQGTAAQSMLEECGVPINELCNEWASQRQSQLSIRAHAPACLKKELDTVLALQADLDTSERALQATREMMTKADATDDTLEALDSLERGHQHLMAKVEVLYASLNVHDQFPELKGVNLDFVRTLLLARDIKINIRKRAIGSFFEWDKLDRAVGGAQQALVTKLHQQTRKAISKCQPALMTALRKFNAYCERLEELYDPTYSIPLPMPLPTKLNDLCNDQSLMEDVWITPLTGDVPRWLEDQDIRDGICAMLKRDRCIEEKQRLGLEADNLCRWFGDELSAIELALLTPGTQCIADEIFLVPLRQRQEHLQHLQTHWMSSLAPAARFTSCATDAISLAQKLSGVFEGCPLECINTFPVSYIIPTEDEEAGQEVFFEADHAALKPEDAVLMDILTGGVTGDAGIIIPGTVETRVSAPYHGCPSQVFEPKDIALLASQTALLNDTCINGCAMLLYLEAVQLSRMVEQFAILSTHDLLRIRYNAPHDVLWQNMSWTRYWAKEVWILPIHRPSHVGHWVLCVVHLRSKELHLFDSFVERKPWKVNIKVPWTKLIQDIMKLIARLLGIARQHNHMVHVNIDFDGWVAHPLITEVVQTNGFDCGVWVLAVIAATLHGYHCMGLREEDMHAFQHYLRTLILQIPGSSGDLGKTALVKIQG
ncbi:uncharacterized protein F5147DRAFT_821605 [Suillus discolor]|uniref:Ubiquitin-like protease family profile domain-containing protein n=1 Tax=Suillus discolor TaxID=1912936 RepID=A0A9P7JN69_9AGAM|nr:uncharacterized protein F5147DRAFT_821605 [Suillus discolor]KAG2092828.1 hypothetical protein F5147DRAFT_821605 [Suillus discolor]